MELKTIRKNSKDVLAFNKRGFIWDSWDWRSPTYRFKYLERKGNNFKLKSFANLLLLTWTLLERFVIPARKATLRLEAYTFHSTVSTQQKTTKTLCGTKTALN